MQKDTLQKAAGYLTRNHRHRIWKKVVSVLACIVVFCTTYALILPAITMEKTASCGIEAHQHSQECYKRVLVCGHGEADSGAGEESGSVDHVHTEECYEMVLTCGKEEHTHAPGCYLDPDEDGAAENCDGESMEAGTEDGTEGSIADSRKDGTEVSIADSRKDGAESSMEGSIGDDREGRAENSTGDSTEDGIEDHTEESTEYSTEDSAGDNPEESGGRITQTCEGEDYTVTVTYGPEAKIPEHAKLRADEYAKDSDHYQERYAEAAELYGWEEDRSDKIRLFNIGFYMEDAEIEPAAEVEVTITCAGQEEEADYEIIHFGEEAETLEPESVYEDGGQRIDFTLDQFSDIMVLAVEGAAHPWQNITLNMYTCTYDDSITDEHMQHYQPGAAKSKTIPGNEAYTYTEGGKTYYLIPVSYFEEAYRDAGFRFTKGSACPFRYGQPEDVVRTQWVNTDSFQNSPSDLELAGYEMYEDQWYVQLQNINNFENIYYARLIEETNTISPTNAIINLFDYWITERYVNDYTTDYEGSGYKDKGINQNHPMKFLNNWENGGGVAMNVCTVSNGVIQGIVDDKLGNDGFPRLSGNADIVGSAPNNNESLAYLFDPSYKGPETEYRAAYSNVKNLLSVDQDGYFWFDAAKRGAEFKEDTNSFTVYKTPVVAAGGDSPFGQFFPFEDAHQAAMQSSLGADMQHYFGMTLTTRFIQQYGGHTNTNREKETIFNFSGDDDVWIFIDGVLVADLGGTHSANSVSINFATGDITIDGVNHGLKYGWKTTETTNLKARFEAAGITTVSWSGNTFADNTTHTLNFYYLERGNWDSTMSLQYNLHEIPPTSIYKVNQYGVAVEGAEFAVYSSDAGWNYDSTQPVYTGVTDANGEMVFEDQYGVPYSLYDLRTMFGEYFVLKETKVPAGYRLVSDETHLHIQNSVLVCENTYDSGVWASPTLQATAPNMLRLVDRKEPQHYYTPESDPEGTLFAVVLKYTGPLGADGLAASDELKKKGNWMPVYGNPSEGYTLETVKNGDITQAAIDTAKRYGTRNVFKLSTSGTMQATLENLPGKVMNYYYMLGDGEKGKTQYTVAYYWSSAASLEEANSGNTVRVNSDVEDNLYSFYRVFGADIEVPNLANRLLVQKFDEEENLVNGATFALFRANENGTYITDNGEEAALAEDKYVAADGTHTALKEGEYTIDVTDASGDVMGHSVITTWDGKTITSHEQRVTNDLVLQDSVGTCVFGIRDIDLTPGCYYLREVKAPAGYQINTTPIMVHVTEKAIYANAGTTGDGVTVARGPGYIVSPLHKAASDGDIDNTLTWIYQKLRVSDVSDSFAEAVSENRPNWGYARGTDEDGVEKDLASYLHYTRTPQQLGWDRYLANYTVDKENVRSPIEGTMRTHTQQIATDVGWSYNEIYQDYDYGISQLRSGVNYTDLRDENGDPKDISNLFSRSVYVQVTDERDSALEISKKVEGVPEGMNVNDVEFTFTVTVEGAEGKKYDYTIYKSSDRTPIADGTGRISSGGTIKLKNGQVAVISNLPGGAGYTVTETRVSGYQASYSVDGAPGVKGLAAAGTLNWAAGEDGSRTSAVDFTNTYTKPLDLTLLKYETGTEIPLKDARFVLCYTAEGTKYYYENGGWVTLNADKTPESLALATDPEGRITFANIPDGTYDLEEIAAPDGYLLPEKPISFTVVEGKITGVSTGNYTDTTVTAYNSTGVILPNTGGAGTNLFTISGWLCMAAAAGCGYRLRRGRKKRKAV